VLKNHCHIRRHRNLIFPPHPAPGQSGVTGHARPTAFKGAIRVVEGEVPGFRPKWKRGFGRWVGEVLVWAKAPSLFRNELVAVDGMTGQVRAAGPGDKVKRLRHGPVIVPLTANGARVEVAAAANNRERAVGPFTTPANTDPGASQRRADTETVTEV
jgi:hypothetical protein